MPHDLGESPRRINLKYMKKLFIAFANQKGGCGKSTLCALFANYLSELGKEVIVVDFDNQGSLAGSRNIDLQRYPGCDIPYGIRFHNIAPSKYKGADENKKYIRDKLNEAARFADIILIDTPGNLREYNLVNLFCNCDYLIVPFSYDKNTAMSMLQFRATTQVLTDPEKKYKAHFKTFYLVNRYKKNVGTAEEHKQWKKIDIAVGKEGILVPPVKDTVDMIRYTTLFLSDKQRQAVKPCFDAINAYIFEGKQYLFNIGGDDDQH